METLEVRFVLPKQSPADQADTLGAMWGAATDNGATPVSMVVVDHEQGPPVQPIPLYRLADNFRSDAYDAKMEMGLRGSSVPREYAEGIRDAFQDAARWLEDALATTPAEYAERWAVTRRGQQALDES